jgi:hypothetical protein
MRKTSATVAAILLLAAGLLTNAAQRSLIIAGVICFVVAAALLTGSQKGRWPLKVIAFLAAYVVFMGARVLGQLAQLLRAVDFSPSEIELFALAGAVLIAAVLVTIGVALYLRKPWSFKAGIVVCMVMVLSAGATLFQHWQGGEVQAAVAPGIFRVVFWSVATVFLYYAVGRKQHLLIGV